MQYKSIILLCLINANSCFSAEPTQAVISCIPTASDGLSISAGNGHLASSEKEIEDSADQNKELASLTNKLRTCFNDYQKIKTSLDKKTQENINTLSGAHFSLQKWKDNLKESSATPDQIKNLNTKIKEKTEEKKQLEAELLALNEKSQNKNGKTAADLNQAISRKKEEVDTIKDRNTRTIKKISKLEKPYSSAYILLTACTLFYLPVLTQISIKRPLCADVLLSIANWNTIAPLSLMVSLYVFKKVF